MLLEPGGNFENTFILSHPYQSHLLCLPPPRLTSLLRDQSLSKQLGVCGGGGEVGNIGSRALRRLAGAPGPPRLLAGKAVALVKSVTSAETGGNSFA